MPYLPTDLEIFNRVFEDYYAGYEINDRGDSDKQHLPIDIKKIASKLKTSEGIIWSRLFYHPRNEEVQLIRSFSGRPSELDGMTEYVLFKPGRGMERNVINFPLMASILADLRSQHRTQRNNFWTAVVSVTFAAISAIAAAVQIVNTKPALPPMTSSVQVSQSPGGVK